MKRTVISPVFLLSCGRVILSIRFIKRQLLHGSWALWAFIVAVGLLPLAAATSQNRPAPSDDSDWWSFTRRPDEGHEALIQNREPPASNFQILGLMLDDDIFSKATAKLGKAPVVERGDASTGRSQICYSSPEKQGRIYLAFEKGEVNEVFYLFEDGPDWNGSDLCITSNLIAKNLSVASGLRLGNTPAEIRKILGKPSVAAANKLVYIFSMEKKTSASDFENLKTRHPELSEEELHREYEFYTLTAYVEARFSKGKLTYLAVSKLEVY